MKLSIFDAAREEPSRIALIAGEVEVSFAELARRVERRLGELQAAGALDPRGDRPVAVVGHPTLATVETLLALLAAGTPALVVHARASESERASICERARAVSEPLPTAATTGHGLPRVELPAFDAERVAALLATSGSTGVPRLVRLSHRAFLAAAHAIGAHYGIEDDRWLLALPLAHVGGLGMLVRCLVQRRTLVLFEPKRSVLAELDALVATAERKRVTLISLVPTLLARLLEPPLSWRPAPSLRAVVLGGAPIAAELVRRAREAQIPVVPTYGLTETCASAVSGRYAERLAPPETSGEILPSGVALQGIEFRLAGGVIELRGDTLFSGYLDEPDSDPRGGWLATHDRGFIDPGGNLVVNGRTSDVIITAGENVDPAEVEAALLSVPGVRLACVIGVPDVIFGELVMALLVATDEVPRTPSALAERLASRLAPYKRPRRVELVPELPLTPSGKIDRRAARKSYTPKG